MFSIFSVYVDERTLKSVLFQTFFFIFKFVFDICMYYKYNCMFPVSQIIRSDI